MTLTSVWELQRKGFGAWWRNVCSILFSSLLFCSVLYYSFLFCSILFYSILLSSILFYSPVFYSFLFYSVLFFSTVFCSLLFCSILFCCLLFFSFLFCSVLTHLPSNARISVWLIAWVTSCRPDHDRYVSAELHRCACNADWSPTMRVQKTDE